MREKKYDKIRPNWIDMTPGLLRGIKRIAQYLELPAKQVERLHGSGDLPTFRIRSRKIWITRDPPKQARGYRRADLEAAWRDYCAEPGTAEQSNGRKYLRSVPLE